jgi:Amt family ammonium transporter
MPQPIFESCSEAFPDGNTTALLKCVSDQFEEQQNERALDLQSFLFVTAGAMIFFMQSGFAMVCAGAVRLKNVQNSMLKNLLDACGAAVAFYLVGKLNEVEVLF